MRRRVVGDLLPQAGRATRAPGPAVTGDRGQGDGAEIHMVAAHRDRRVDAAPAIAGPAAVAADARRILPGIVRVGRAATGAAIAAPACVDQGILRLGRQPAGQCAAGYGNAGRSRITRVAVVPARTADAAGNDGLARHDHRVGDRIVGLGRRGLAVGGGPAIPPLAAVKAEGRRGIQVEAVRGAQTVGGNRRIGAVRPGAAIGAPPAIARLLIGIFHALRVGRSAGDRQLSGDAPAPATPAAPGNFAIDDQGRRLAIGGIERLVIALGKSIGGKRAHAAGQAITAIPAVHVNARIPAVFPGKAAQLLLPILVTLDGNYIERAGNRSHDVFLP